MSYSKMKIDELRKLAGEKGLRDIDTLKKSELIELLANVDLMMSRAAEKKDEPAKPENKPEKKDEPAGAAKKAEKKDDSDVAAVKAKRKTGTSETSERKKKKSNPAETVDNAEEKAKEKTADDNTEDKPADTEKNESNNRRADGQGRRKTPAVKGKTVREGAKRAVKKPADDAEAAADAKTDDRSQERTERSDRVEKPERPEKTEEVQEKKPEAAQASQYDGQDYNPALASGEMAFGILEVLSEGYGFIRSDNYMPGDKDIYISPAQIRRFGLRTGDIIRGPIRARMNQNEKFRALLYIESVNSMSPSEISRRPHFEDMTPIFPNERIRLDYNNAPVSIRIVDLFSPIGKGQRGMIVSPPKAGKTTLLKQIAKRISVAYPEMNLLVLLIDERPEEVTDIKESIEGPNAEVIYSTFDELPEHHKRVSEMVIERAKRLVESKKDVVILIDSITRLSRAYNLTVSPSGRTLSGGLDPAALHMPKKFFGAARNMREGGSLTILATALIDTGSRMDDVVFEEFKGTGNMELVLDRNLSEKRVFPAIDIAKSGTRKDDLLLTDEEQEVLDAIHRQLRGLKSEEVTEDIIKIFAKTRNNREFLDYCRKLFVRKQV